MLDILTLLSLYMPYIILFWIVWFVLIIPYLLFTESGKKISQKYFRV